jgi:hypothetical protein
MQTYIKEEFKRAFLSKSTVLSITLVFLSIFIGAIESFLFPVENNAFNLLIIGYSGGTASILSVLFPILVSIPFASSYIDDSKTGYLKYILTKTKLINYIKIRLLANGLIGGFVLSFCLSISFFLFVILKGTKSSVIHAQINILKDIFETNPFLYIFLLILNSFVCGMVFATFALGISTFLKNKYLTVIFPFIFYILSGTLLYKINPLLHSAVTYDLQYGGSSLTTVIIYDLIMLIVGITTFVFGVLKNVEQDI